MENLPFRNRKGITLPASTEQSAGVKLASERLLSKTPNIEASIEIDPNSLFNFQISRGFDIGVRITGGGFLNYVAQQGH
jgi:hypothetical protein